MQIADGGTPVVFLKSGYLGVANFHSSFSLEEVKLLAKTLTDKFNLKCTIFQQRGKHVIRISAKSMPELRNLLKDIMPPMMKYKIGLK